MPRKTSVWSARGVEKVIDEIDSETMSPEELEEMAEALLRSSDHLRRRAESLRLHVNVETRLVDFAEVTRTRVKTVRSAARITQEELAEGMREIGFPWNRLTVVEIERGNRRVSLTEVIGLAALFGLPGMSFLLPNVSEHIAVPAASDGIQGTPVPAAEVHEILLGRDGQIGTGGSDWDVARKLAFVGTKEADWRPAQAIEEGPL